MLTTSATAAPAIRNALWRLPIAKLLRRPVAKAHAHAFLALQTMATVNVKQACHSEVSAVQTTSVKQTIRSAIAVRASARKATKLAFEEMTAFQHWRLNAITESATTVFSATTTWFASTINAPATPDSRLLETMNAKNEVLVTLARLTMTARGHQIRAVKMVFVPACLAIQSNPTWHRHRIEQRPASRGPIRQWAKARIAIQRLALLVRCSASSPSFALHAHRAVWFAEEFKQCTAKRSITNKQLRLHWWLHRRFSYLAAPVSLSNLLTPIDTSIHPASQPLR